MPEMGTSKCSLQFSGQLDNLPHCLSPSSHHASQHTASKQQQINPVTVIGLLEVSQAKPGDHLVITAAGSTLSRMLIAAARAQGIKTIGVVRRPEAVQEVKSSTG